jgi:hypothetical protein
VPSREDRENLHPNPALSPTTTPAPASAQARQAPPIPDHTLMRHIGGGSYGEVWLAQNVMGAWRAVKIVYRGSFEHERPYEREYHGIRKFEPVSRTHEGLVDILHVGRHDDQGCFYYVMELADDAKDRGQTSTGRDERPQEEGVDSDSRALVVT